MTKRPKNDAVDKIWDDHLGNNAFVWHRDQCTTCLPAYQDRLRRRRQLLPEQPHGWCTDGERIFDEVLDEVCDKMDEVIDNQN